MTTPTDAELATLSIHAMAEAERRGEDLEGQLVASHRAIYEAARSEASGAWIPCEERMPVPGAWVEFVVARDREAEPYAMCGCWHNGSWTSFGMRWTPASVTHWRELPELP